jgi:hypothetical protein
MKNLVTAAFAGMMITAAAAQPMAVPGSEAAASAFGPDPIIQINDDLPCPHRGVGGSPRRAEPDGTGYRATNALHHGGE